MQIDYFKRLQTGKIYHYYKVVGGPGRTKKGFQEVLNFLNDKPLIYIEHNDISSLTGTWCTYEVGEPISRQEYEEAYKIAIEGEFEVR